MIYALSVSTFIEHCHICISQNMDLNTVNFKYSLKNVPVPGKKAYCKLLIEKVEAVIKRMRWKAFYYEKSIKESAEVCNSPVSTGSPKNEKGDCYQSKFPSKYCPPQNQLLNAFENDMYDLIRTIKFQHVSNEFLLKLNKDVEKIKKSEKIFVFGDKSTNLYMIKKDDYEKTLNDNITKTYKKANHSIITKIDKDAQKIAKTINMDHKIQQFGKKSAFITFKDHKPNFKNKNQCRLINPAKSEIGIVSKSILERINNEIRNKTGFKQWRNTTSVIDWFKGIKNKQKCKFLKFDIVDFYPSITEEILKKSLDFAQSLTELNESEIEIIQQARNSVLFQQDNIWIKKSASHDKPFDVAMGSFDGAEICELVGLFILSILTKRFGKNCIGLYRDDGLAIIPNANGPKSEKARKDVTKLFKDQNLKITSECNLHTTDFLDVTFDLNNNTFCAYKKPNSYPLYIHKNSNHPPTIIKNLPTNIGKRISDLSSNFHEFDKVKDIYQKALKDSGYKKEIAYEIKKSTGIAKTRNRKRNIIWFNPPYSKNVSTNVGKKFLTLIEKHFPENHKYRILFNRNNLKVSYCCTDNMETIIKKHNAQILNKQTRVTEKMCNCRKAENCPLQGNCLQNEIVYKANIHSQGKLKCYFGLSEGQFKTRYNNHKTSFKYIGNRENTELAKYIWKLKETNKKFEITWEIAEHAKACKAGSKRCHLCLAEKLLIANAPRKSTINKRSELITTCRHRNKFYLQKLESKKTKPPTQQ